MEVKSDYEKGYIEGYFRGLADLMSQLTGESPCSKHYDPATVDSYENMILSYAFDLKEGGRRHRLSLFSDRDDLLHTALDEAVEWIKAEDD
jgi:hypothetical protein